MTAHLTRWAAFPLVFTLFVILTIAPVRATGDLGNSGKFVGWWELGGYYGTDDSSRGEIVLFTPLAQSATTIFFLDARAKLFEDDVQEGNFALGYRQMMPSGWNLGLWGGWDLRDTTNDNTFNQISFGFEALSERYDVRVNGYVPLEDSKGVSDTNSFEALLQGNNILVQGTNTDTDELAFYGVDAEFGILLFGGNRGGGSGFKDSPTPAKRHELRAYAGGFYFDNDDADDAVAGPKGRLEYRINDIVSGLPGSRLTIESELSYDEVRDTKFEIGARLRIPFGSRGSDAATRTAALTGQELRMIEGLERDTDIVTNEETETTVTTEGAIDDATNVALDNVSFVKTADQLAKAVNDGGNRLIIVQKGNKRIDVSDSDGQQLQDDQTVQGGASTILIRGKKTGEVVPFTAPGKQPTIFSNDTNAFTGMITVNNNTHVAGVQFRGVGDRNTSVGGNNGISGIPGTPLSNVVIEQNSFAKIGGVTVRFNDDNSNVWVLDNSITDSRSDGVFFNNDNTNINVWGNTITNLGPSANGVFFGDRNENVMVSDNTFDDIGNNAIFLRNENKNVTLYHNTISNVDRGILIRDMNENFTISHATIKNTGDNGIQIDNDNTNFTLSDLNIRNAGSRAVEFGDRNTSFTIENSELRNAGSNAVRFGDDNSKLTFRHLTITEPGSTGINGFSDNNKITIEDVTITNPSGNGINLNQDNLNVLIKNTTIVGGDQLMSDGIALGSGTDADIIGVRITNPNNEGIDLFSNHVVTIKDTVITGGSAVMIDGIEMTANNVVTIENVTINGKGASGQGIEIFGTNNDVTISNVTIKDTNSGLEVNNNGNTISMNDTTFSGNFTDNVLELTGTPNNLSGSGNVFDGTTAGVFCNSGAQNGAFTFVDPPATCP